MSSIPLRAALVCALVFLATIPVANASNTIRLSEIVDANGRYSTGLIKLAIQHAAPDYAIEHTGEGNMSQLRLIEEVKSGNLSIMWAGTTMEMEQTLRPVRIPLYKGLLGHRVLIIRQGQQAAFNNIQTLEQMRGLTLGQGRTWSDTFILEANGFHVTKANKYGSLFYMVDGGRFDAFPRGVQEPWGEIRTRPELELTVEQHLMMVYKMPFYLFVAPDDVELAGILERGLRAAIEDGSFDDYFFKDPMVRDVLEKANLKNRTAFYLDNPTLSKETPLEDKTLWLDPYSL